MDERLIGGGMPKELYDYDEITKETQRIKIKTTKRSFRKLVTVITGFESAESAKKLGKILKKNLACGGTVKEKEIELQGDHKRRVKEILIEKAYKEELIDD